MCRTKCGNIELVTHRNGALAEHTLETLYCNDLWFAALAGTLATQD